MGLHPCFESRGELLNAVNEFQVLGSKSVAVETYGPIRTWCVNQITDMSSLFALDSTFNADLSGWDVSNVKDMSYMFQSNANFDASTLAGWDVRNVQNMSHTFTSCCSPTNDKLSVSNWHVGNVVDFTSMFQQSTFEDDLSRWDVSSGRYMNQMFAGAHYFNSNLDQWDVRNVQDMTEMFAAAEQFNQNLCSWGQKLNQDSVIFNNPERNLIHGGTQFVMFASTKCTEQGNPIPGSNTFGPFCTDCSVRSSPGTQSNPSPSTTTTGTQPTPSTTTAAATTTTTEGLTQSQPPPPQLETPVLILSLVLGVAGLGFIVGLHAVYQSMKDMTSMDDNDENVIIFNNNNRDETDLNSIT